MSDNHDAVFTVEDGLRKLFIHKPDSHILDEAHLILADPYNDQSDRLRIVSQELFKLRFRIFSESLLEGFDWTGCVAVGLPMVHCLLPNDNTDEQDNDPVQIRSKFNTVPTSLTLRLYGIDPDQIKDQLDRIHTHLQTATPYPITIVSYKDRVEFQMAHPLRTISIDSTLYRSKTEALIDQPIDSFCVGYDGNTVSMTQRCINSWLVRYNILRPATDTDRYIGDLVHSSELGFRVGIEVGIRIENGPNVVSDIGTVFGNRFIYSQGNQPLFRLLRMLYQSKRLVEKYNRLNLSHLIRWPPVTKQPDSVTSPDTVTIWTVGIPSSILGAKSIVTGLEHSGIDHTGRNIYQMMVLNNDIDGLSLNRLDIDQSNSLIKVAESVFMEICKYGTERMLDCFLDCLGGHRFNPYKRSHHGWDPIQTAVLLHRFEFVQMLLAKGFKLELDRDEEKKQPSLLTHCWRINCVELVKFLLHQKIDPKQVQKTFESEIQTGEPNPTMVSLFIDYGVDLNTMVFPLVHLLAQHQQDNTGMPSQLIVKMLDNGAKPSISINMIPNSWYTTKHPSYRHVEFLQNVKQPIHQAATDAQLVRILCRYRHANINCLENRLNIHDKVVNELRKYDPNVYDPTDRIIIKGLQLNEEWVETKKELEERLDWIVGMGGVSVDKMNLSPEFKRAIKILPTERPFPAPTKRVRWTKPLIALVEKLVDSRKNNKKLEDDELDRLVSDCSFSVIRLWMLGLQLPNRRVTAMEIFDRLDPSRRTVNLIWEHLNRTTGPAVHLSTLSINYCLNHGMIDQLLTFIQSDRCSNRYNFDEQIRRLLHTGHCGDAHRLIQYQYPTETSIDPSEWFDNYPISSIVYTINILSDRYEMAEQLNSDGWKMFQTDPDHKIPLVLKIPSISTEFVESLYHLPLTDNLIQLIQNHPSTDSDPVNCMIISAKMGNDDNLIRLLEMDPKLIDYRFKHGQTVLMLAVRYRLARLIDWLVNKGVDQMKTDRMGNTCYHYHGYFSDCFDESPLETHCYENCVGMTPGNIMNERWLGKTTGIKGYRYQSGERAVLKSNGTSIHSQGFSIDQLDLYDMDQF